MILATKMKNVLKKANENYGYDLQFDIKNININGSKRGCSGFVTNKENGSCVYINTELTGCSWLELMYRYADNNKDYKGYRNRWGGDDNNINEMADNIMKMLKKLPKDVGEKRI